MALFLEAAALAFATHPFFSCNKTNSRGRNASPSSSCLPGNSGDNVATTKRPQGRHESGPNPRRCGEVSPTAFRVRDARPNARHALVGSHGYDNHVADAAHAAKSVQLHIRHACFGSHDEHVRDAADGAGPEPWYACDGVQGFDDDKYPHAALNASSAQPDYGHACDGSHGSDAFAGAWVATDAESHCDFAL